jgi:hypothetical protein
MSDYLALAGWLPTLLAPFAISLALKRYFTKPKLPSGVRFPPGPPSLPLLGSALAVDVSEPWVTYKAWGSQYGKWSRRMTAFVVTDDPQATWFIPSFLVKITLSSTPRKLHEISSNTGRRITPTDQT